MNVLWDQRNVFLTQKMITFGGKVSFENLNLEFLAGKTTAIVGPLGMGKSTLLNWVLML